MSQKRKIFGTDGVRGVANVYPMTVEMAMAIGRGVAAVVKAQKGRRTIIIGKDTRLSGYMFENALVAGILSMGADVNLVGPMPTPAIAFLTRSMRAKAGIVISASHNPYQDNGIKIFGGDGYKLPDELEAEVEHFALAALNGGDDHLRPTADEIGRARRIEDAPGRYIVFLKNIFPAEYTLEGMTIALDCAHGATYKVAPAVFSELGAELVQIGVEPDGTNINQGVGSLHPQQVAEAVRSGRAQLGLAFDGDGDRLILVDDKGRLVDGDQVMAVCASHMLAHGELNHATVVATVMSNLGLELALREQGIRLLRTQVGDRYVVEAMRQGGYNLGGEQSGHLVFLDHNTTGDGILSALMVLKVMMATGKPLSELVEVMSRVPQKLVNLRVKQRRPLSETTELAAAMKAVEERLGAKGRILVRYSGTEPLLRIMVEATDRDLMEDAAGELAQAARRDLGVVEE